MALTEAQAAVQSITAVELYAKLQSDEGLFILDVRNAEDFGRWRIEGRDTLQTRNIPYYDVIEDEESAVAQVPTGRPVLVVCAKEGASRYVADVLHSHGVEVSYLEGGILTWGNLYDVRPIVDASWGTILQVARPARGDLSFVLVSDGAAAVVDPLRHIEHYTRVIAEAGGTLTYIFDTHIHADHISGGPALARETGAPYYVHPYDAIHPIDMLPARMAYTPLMDGQMFTVGRFTITVVWFPGHTLGQVNFLVEAPDQSRYLFTGDGIFLRSFGRPDLGGQGEAWAPLLYESIFERLPAHIDDRTLILPAHFSRLDEGDVSGRFAASYGETRQMNEALSPRSKDAFIAYVLGHLPVFPPQYVQIKRVNIGLSTPSEEAADDLELGKNICAISG